MPVQSAAFGLKKNKTLVFQEDKHRNQCESQKGILILLLRVKQNGTKVATTMTVTKSSQVNSSLFV